MTILTKPGGSAIARPRTFLNLILDESSSMSAIRDRTIRAVNDFLDEQRGQRIDELFVTITLFSDARRVRSLFKGREIAAVKPLTFADYVTSVPSTALYDGIAYALADMDKLAGQGDRVLNVVVTDGHENSSREVTSLEQLLQIKASYEARGNWTFVFLASTADAMATGRDMGFRPGNIETYEQTPDGVSTGLQKVSNAVKDYRWRDDLQTETFYNPPKRYARPQWAADPTVVVTDD